MALDGFKKASAGDEAVTTSPPVPRPFCAQTMGVTSPPTTRFEIKSALEAHAKTAAVEIATPKAPSPTSLIDQATQVRATPRPRTI